MKVKSFIFFTCIFLISSTGSNTNANKMPLKTEEDKIISPLNALDVKMTILADKLTNKIKNEKINLDSSSTTSVR